MRPSATLHATTVGWEDPRAVGKSRHIGRLVAATHGGPGSYRAQPERAVPLICTPVAGRDDRRPRDLDADYAGCGGSRSLVALCLLIRHGDWRAHSRAEHHRVRGRRRITSGTSNRDVAEGATRTNA